MTKDNWEFTKHTWCYNHKELYCETCHRNWRGTINLFKEAIAKKKRGIKSN